MKATHITVRTREGTALFRRAGFVFTRAPQDIALSELSPEQLEAIRGEPLLEVAETAAQPAPSRTFVPPPAPAPTGDDDGGDPKRRSSKR